MRVLVLAPVFLLGIATLACDCTQPIYEAQRIVSADIMWSGAARDPSWGPDTWVGIGQTDTGDRDIVWFNDDSAPPAVAGDLRIFPLLGAHSASEPGAPDNTKLTFILIIHGVSGHGPAEIDLDDTRATLKVGFAGLSTESMVGDGIVHHGIAGHVGLTQFSASCAGSCYLTVGGTFSFTATGEHGELVAVTSGTLAGTNTVYKGSQQCVQGRS
jgi:hypothetical protein